MPAMSLSAAGGLAVPASPNVTCPACGAAEGLRSLYALSGIPVQSTLLLRSREEALSFPTGDLELCWCSGCGFAFNARFDPALVDYSTGYEDSQGVSPTFLRFATALARDWIERYRLEGRHIVEIGCGKGDFLRLICAEGGCTGTGFDPAFVPGRATDLPGLSFWTENFTDAHVPLEADFLICRHTLEHIGDVGGFLDLMRRACGPSRTIRLVFEVPDLRRVLAEGAFWDVYYEHAAYFTAGSLSRAFAHAGFNVLDVRRVYGDQYLVLEAAPATEGLGDAPLIDVDDLEETALLVARFREDSIARIEAWRTLFADWRARGQRVALWGSGSKAVGFLTTIGDPGIVSCVVDINPQRHGCYMPGCAIPIVAPQVLSEYCPNNIIVMNPMYCTEITSQIHSMKLDPEILTVDAPVPPRRQDA